MSDARFLVTAYGTYLAHHHGKLHAVPVPDDHCKFHFEIHHHHIAIRTHHHHFVGVNHHHEVYVTDHHHDSQLFHIERMADGRIALKSHAHHSFIGVDSHGHVKAHHHIEAGQLFSERPVAYGMAPAMAYGAPQVAYGAPPPQVAYGMAPQVAYGAPAAVISTSTTYTSPPGVFTSVAPSYPGVAVYSQPTVGVVYESSGHHHHHHGHHHHHHHHGHH